MRTRACSPPERLATGGPDCPGRKRKRLAHAATWNDLSWINARYHRPGRAPDASGTARGPVAARPGRNRRRARRPARSTVPASGRPRPRVLRSSVVFPLPLGPSKSHPGPGVSGERQVGEEGAAAQLLAPLFQRPAAWCFAIGGGKSMSDRRGRGIAGLRASASLRINRTPPRCALWIFRCVLWPRVAATPPRGAPGWRGPRSCRAWPGEEFLLLAQEVGCSCRRPGSSRRGTTRSSSTTVVGDVLEEVAIVADHDVSERSVLE